MVGLGLGDRFRLLEFIAEKISEKGILGIKSCPTYRGCGKRCFIFGIISLAPLVEWLRVVKQSASTSRADPEEGPVGYPIVESREPTTVVE